VVGFRDKVTYLMPFKKADGLATGARVLPAAGPSSIQIGPSWMGRMVNGLGEPIDGLGRLGGDQILSTTPPQASTRCARRRWRNRWTSACARSIRCSRSARASASA
jgi:flagellar biosynthesis/type III secretory pathway ATPase